MSTWFEPAYSIIPAGHEHLSDAGWPECPRCGAKAEAAILAPGEDEQANHLTADGRELHYWSVLRDIVLPTRRLYERAEQLRQMMMAKPGLLERVEAGRRAAGPPEDLISLDEVERRKAQGQ